MYSHSFSLCKYITNTFHFRATISIKQNLYVILCKNADNIQKNHGIISLNKIAYTFK